MTLYDLGMEVTKIREAVDSLEVKGKKNASLVVYAFEKCNDIIEAINAVVNQESDSSQNGDGQTDKEEEVNGEPDSGTA
ncbi:MAG: hypothetical protein IJ523_07040 [Succinivibrionaceae bacterium]|nr:hypothetical protein [Succinivibrionaceae bacterium]